jgi:nicotinate dehydrogenase subunit A
VPGRPGSTGARRPRALALAVNGTHRSVTVAPDAPLLTVLRNDLGLCGPKYGCGLGQCGACTVLVDGVAARACVIPVAGIVGRRITTLEGLGRPDDPHPVQQAFIDEQAAQCGYCLNGMIMTAAALLEGEPAADEARIRSALSGNLCRCGTHVEIVRAVLRAARSLRAARAVPSASSADAARPSRAAAAEEASEAAGEAESAESVEPADPTQPTRLVRPTA